MSFSNRTISGTTLCLFLLLYAATSSADSIDRYIRAEMTNQHLPGLALAVIRDGKPVKVKTYGLANIELDVLPCAIRCGRRQCSPMAHRPATGSAGGSTR
jgi:CubicO group peptidase (beta-lactamase class C family)